jgi:hypothetical protein
MIKFLRIAALALPIALVAPAPAQANPMVAIGWLWAAGAGGLLLGIVGTNLYHQNRMVVVAPAQAQPVAYETYGCRVVKVRYEGRWHRAQICD